jgi:hypothetical protein
MRQFEQYDTETLEIIKGNLLRGLDRIAETLDNGTFHTPREKGSAPPSQGGFITLGLLQGIQEELAFRLTLDQG